MARSMELGVEIDTWTFIPVWKASSCSASKLVGSDVATWSVFCRVSLARGKTPYRSATSRRSQDATSPGSLSASRSTSGRLSWRERAAAIDVSSTNLISTSVRPSLPPHLRCSERAALSCDSVMRPASLRISPRRRFLPAGGGFVTAPKPTSSGRPLRILALVPVLGRVQLVRLRLLLLGQLGGLVELPAGLLAGDGERGGEAVPRGLVVHLPAGAVRRPGVEEERLGRLVLRDQRGPLQVGGARARLLDVGEDAEGDAGGGDRLVELRVPHVAAVHRVVQRLVPRAPGRAVRHQHHRRLRLLGRLHHLLHGALVVAAAGGAGDEVGVV